MLSSLRPNAKMQHTLVALHRRASPSLMMARGTSIHPTRELMQLVRPNSGLHRPLSTMTGTEAHPNSNTNSNTDSITNSITNSNTATNATPIHTHSNGMVSKPDFSDASLAHGSKSTPQLLLSLMVFNACQLRWLVQHAEFLLRSSTKILGSTITNTVMKYSFFQQFCAGENMTEMKQVIDSIGKSDIGPILDYAAESEGNEEESDGLEGIFSQPPFNQPARIYDYKSERECDKHVEIFKDCIRTVTEVSGNTSTSGFAALKVIALGNPELLERMSNIIVEVKNLFSKFDEKETGFINREEFVRCYEYYFHSDEKLDEVLDFLDPNNTGMIDYISFARMFTPYTLPTFTQKCKNVGPLALATPSAEEITLMKKMSERLRTLAEEACRCGTKLLIDAEHQKYQPAIDSLVLELQQEFNAKDKVDRPVIFNTYQCYLKDSHERMKMDLERSERYSFHFAAKLVRGAYMVHERERAKKLRIPSPIHDTAEDTHRCYDESVETLLRRRFQNGPGLEVMIATHNKASIEKAVSLMNELGLEPKDESVHFAQLYGMSDNLSFTLGRYGFNAFKYLPYGEVKEVLPYLVRRAQENGDMLGNATAEVNMLKEELKRRFSFA